MNSQPRVENALVGQCEARPTQGKWPAPPGWFALKPTSLKDGQRGLSAAGISHPKPNQQGQFKRWQRRLSSLTCTPPNRNHQRLCLRIQFLFSSQTKRGELLRSFLLCLASLSGINKRRGMGPQHPAQARPDQRREYPTFKRGRFESESAKASVKS